MFPVQEVSTENFNKSNNKISEGGKSFLFNFKTGEFDTRDGKVTEVEGYDALKVWIQKVLMTEKYKYRIYDDTGYGVSVKELLISDYPYAFIKSELEKEIRESMLNNKEIKAIESIQFTRNKRNLKISFLCKTIYGEIESEVEFNE